MADKGCGLVFTKVYMQQHIGAGNTISPWQRTMSSVWAYRQNKYTEHVNKGFQGSRKWLSLVQPDLGLLPSRTRWEKWPDIDLGKRGVWIQCETKRQHFLDKCAFVCAHLTGLTCWRRSSTTLFWKISADLIFFCRFSYFVFLLHIFISVYISKCCIYTFVNLCDTTLQNSNCLSATDFYVLLQTVERQRSSIPTSKQQV